MTTNHNAGHGPGRVSTVTAIRPREVTDVTTGESLALVPADHAQEFSMQQYLASVTTPAALEAQKQLAAAYDAACHALIGDNDVQKEGGREFKKKSAWRKLGRHFRISTSIVRVDKEWTAEGGFLATVTVRATAPWDQCAESVGACGTDEATGRRTITTADAIATAETRATNRAVSNLIAMGEVSAEEMGNRPAPSPAPRAAASRPAPAGNAASHATNGGSATSHTPRGTTSTTTDDPACPVCSGKMWDNRADKRNPRAPDFKCRDRSCEGVIWPPKDAAHAPAPVVHATVSASGPLVEDGPPPPDDDDLPF